MQQEGNLPAPSTAMKTLCKEKFMHMLSESAAALWHSGDTDEFTYVSCNCSVKPKVLAAEGAYLHKICD